MTEHTATIIPFDPKADAALLELAGDDAAASGPVVEKLQDALTPGYQAEFDPAEAEAAGAFQEDALSEADALDSSHDTLHFQAPAAPATE